MKLGLPTRKNTKVQRSAVLNSKFSTHQTLIKIFLVQICNQRVRINVKSQFWVTICQLTHAISISDEPAQLIYECVHSNNTHTQSAKQFCRDGLSLFFSKDRKVHQSITRFSLLHKHLFEIHPGTTRYPPGADQLCHVGLFQARSDRNWNVCQ
jgi:hypothetical protein